jgi:hypothetical protein
VGDTVFIETVTLANSYPAGAYVYVSAESQQAGIIVGENAVRIYAEGQSLGRLATAIDGTVTSIEAHLYTKLVRGMDFLIINQQTGRTYSFNVDQDTAGPGVVTFDVQEQIATARVGDYLVGDNSFQQSQITVTQGQIVLKVNANNKVAQIKLGADDLGSEIDISAEQVKINGIIFTEGTDPIYTPGDIATSNYSAGVAGWKIDGDGSAEFNNVVVRGSVEGGATDKRYSLTPSGGIELGVSGSYSSTLRAGALVLDTSASVDPATPQVTLKGDELSVLYGNVKMRWFASDANNGTLVLSLSNVPKVTLNGATGAGTFAGVVTANDTTDSTSKDTGSIITEGGIGIEKNAYIGGSLNAPKVTITPISDTDSPYAVLSTDTHIAVDNGLSAVTINLPTGTDGRKVTIYDRGGTALLGTITINRASTNTINGLTSTTLTTNYQSVTLLFYGGNWTII